MRVLWPGGVLVGYDLVESPVSRLTHNLDRSPHRMSTIDGLRTHLGSLPFDHVTVTSAIARLVARFRARRSTSPDPS